MLAAIFGLAWQQFCEEVDCYHHCNGYHYEQHLLHILLFAAGTKEA